jgi:hypothetical protein
MAKFEEPYEDIESLFNDVITNHSTLPPSVNIKLLADNKLKKIFKVMRANDLVKYRTGDDVFIIINQNIFEQLEEQQKFIHKHTRNDEPIGWENQIANSFLVNYNLLYEHGILLMPWIEVIAQGGLKAGVLNTNGLLGVLTRIGKKRSYFGSTKRKQQNWELYGI